MNRKGRITIIITVSVLGIAAIGFILFFAWNWLFVMSDHTDLEGTIITQTENVGVGETIDLELVLPDELSAVHRIHWEVEPESAGTIEYISVDYDDFEKDKDGNTIYSKDDRYATFTAGNPGKCIIRTYGFYKQTNPQPITEIEIMVYE